MLYYFATSPFFDQTSNNSSIVQQSVYNPVIAQEIFTRRGLEERLKSMSGLEYVVAYDPFESEAKFEGPKGPEFSNIWIIYKQQRRKKSGNPDDVTILAVYYVVGDSIYMAPSVHKAVSNRTVRNPTSGANLVTNIRQLSTATALDKILSISSELSQNSLNHKQANLPEHAKSIAQEQTAQHSDENIPHEVIRPRTVRSKKRELLSSLHIREDRQDSAALKEAFSLSLSYRHDYMDEQPLVGEPGNFMVARMDAPLSSTKSVEDKPNGNDRAPPAPPPLQIDISSTASRPSAKNGDGSPLSASTRDKTKRRKSKQAVSSAA